MADEMKPTPRGFISGLFSDVLGRTLNMPSMPRTGIPSLDLLYANRNPLFNLMGVGDVQKTAERISYGQPLTTGSGMTTKPREETLFAGMAVAPLAPAAGRLASRAVKATEGMPVGMSIKDVSPKIGINVNQGGSSFADKIISGEKKFETRESDSLRSYVGKRVGIIRTGEGKAKAIGDVTLGEPIVISSPEEFAKLRDLHLVPEGSKFDIKKGGVKYLYPIENPVAYEVEKDVAKYGIVSRKILGEPDTLEKALYPQQAALDLAQQRAALPVSEGGLGLPANNTPMDRAKAMGFGTEAYHGTNANVPVFDISKNITAKDIYSSPNPSEASAYATSEGGNVMPLLLRGEVKDLTKESQYVDNQLRKAYNAQVSKYERQYYPFEQFKESFMRGQLYQDTGGQSAQNALVGELIGNRKSILKIPDAVSDFGVGESYVTQNPANIRSRFAAFDPFRKDVATATAMGVALPDLLAQPVNQYQPTYETIPMYTDPFGNTIGSSIR